MDSKENKKTFSARLERFVAGRGYYVVLAICAVVIGVSVWSLLKTPDQSQSTATASTVVAPVPVDLPKEGLGVKLALQKDLGPAGPFQHPGVFLLMIVRHVGRGHDHHGLSHIGQLRQGGGPGPAGTGCVCSAGKRCGTAPVQHHRACL